MTIGTLTACILASNNEKTITSAITSVLPHADRCMVVDFGSADNTARTASAVGADVIAGTWEHDFAKARNYALSLVKTPWVLMLDSDEEFVWNGKEALAALLQQHEADGGGQVYALACRNIDAEAGEYLGMTYAERIFRPARYHYTGRIHEALMPDGSISKTTVILHDGSIRHYGYSRSGMKQKSSRNVELLLQELKEQPEDGRILRYLANEAFNQKDYRQAALYAEQSLEHLDISRSAYAAACAFYYLFMSSYLLGDTTTAETQALRCASTLPQYPDVYAFLLELAFMSHRWADALARYEQWQHALGSEPLLPRFFDPYYDDLVLRASDCASLLGQTQKAVHLLLLVYYRNVKREEAVKRLQEYDIQEQSLLNME